MGLSIHHTVLALLLAAVGCGPSIASDAAPTGLPTRMREVASPKVCLAKRRLLEELGHTALAQRAEQSEAKPEREPDLERQAAPPIEVAYGKVAPATVLIRTSSGMGSGVIIDKRGLVLTNQHVIEEFLQLDLTVKVSLELGKVGPTGRIVATGKPLAGVVVASDAVKDLALVKLVDPPSDLTVATLAPRDPRVGESVLSIGNAGIGLLWAAKVCNVSRVGDLTRETSILEAGDCSLRDPLDNEQEATRRQQQCEASKKEIKKRVQQALQGLSIQTTCSLNGGDSGGPLVNAWGEIVGLNQSLRFGGGTLAFHVHVAEIRQFIRDASFDPAALVPDPFCEGGVDFKLEDYDGDGVAESAIAVGDPWFDGNTPKAQGAYLFDTDQDDAKTRASPERPFDADVALLLRGNDAYALYDRDGDGEFDLLLRDRKADGKPESAFELDGGRVTASPKLLPKHTLDGSLMKGGSHLTRLGTAAAGAGISALASPETLASGAVPAVPNVAKTFGKEGYVEDVDEDGRVDSVSAFNGPGSAVLLVDVRSQGLRNLKDGDDAGPVLDPWALEPQFVLLRRLAGTWALYDTDLDGRLDLALFSRRPVFRDDPSTGFLATPEYATDAFELLEGNERRDAPGHLGRALVRPELLPDGWARTALRHHRSETRGGFPEPREGLWGVSALWVLGPLDHERQVLEQAGSYGHVAMVDLDRDTKNRTTASAEELSGEGKFDAEVVMVRFFDRAWVFHDTDHDGAMDLVTFTRDLASGKADSAFTLDASGQVVRPVPVDGGLVRADAVGARGAASFALHTLLERVLLLR